MNLLTWAVSAFAVSWVLADSKLSYPFRLYLSKQGPLTLWLLALLECVACSGFHFGWAGQLLGVAPFETWWMAAAFTCGSNLLLAKYIGLFDRE